MLPSYFSRVHIPSTLLLLTRFPFSFSVFLNKNVTSERKNQEDRQITLLFFLILVPTQDLVGTRGFVSRIRDDRPIGFDSMGRFLCFCKCGIMNMHRYHHFPHISLSRIYGWHATNLLSLSSSIYIYSTPRCDRNENVLRNVFSGKF